MGNGNKVKSTTVKDIATLRSFSPEHYQIWTIEILLVNEHEKKRNLGNVYKKTEMWAYKLTTLLRQTEPFCYS